MAHPEHKKLSENYYPIVAALVVRDGYQCARCAAHRPLVVDHIVAVRRGGITELNNLQFLCKSCNGIKGDETHDFRSANRGRLGYQSPRYTAHGALVIRTATYRYGKVPGFSVEDNEVVGFTAKRTIRLLRARDRRVVLVSLSWVYPPDLQHLFRATT